MITTIPIDKELCEEFELAQRKYQIYNDMLFFVKQNGYNDQYWELWQQLMEVQASCNTLHEFIRVKYIVPLFEETQVNWVVNFQNLNIEIDI